MKTWIVLNPEAKAGLRFARTSYPGHATAIARRAVAEKAEAIVAVGGDGTVREIVNGILGSPVAIGIIPAGTANDLAAYSKIPADLAKAGDVVRGLRTRPAAVIRVNGEYYVTAGGLGLPSEVAWLANRIKS